VAYFKVLSLNLPKGRRKPRTTCQDRLSPGRDLNLRPLECEPGFVITRPRRTMTFIPYPQESATGLYHEPDESIPHSCKLFLYGSFYCSSLPKYPKWLITFRFSDLDSLLNALNFYLCLRKFCLVWLKDMSFCWKNVIREFKYFNICFICFY
jgi:hypothetical protein